MIKSIFSLIFLCGSAFAAKMSVKNGQFFVDCKLESQKELCLINTGTYAARIRPLGPIAKYASLGKAKSEGISGEVLASDLKKIKSITAENLVQSNVTGATLPDAFQYSVLGVEFFKSFSKVTFNFDQLEIRKGLLPVKNICPTEMRLKNHLIQLEVKVNDKPLFAAFDTGASMTVVNKQIVENNPALFKFAKEIPAGKDSGGNPVSVKMYVLKVLGLCGMNYQDVNIVAVDMTSAKASQPGFPDIFLGANLMVGNSWSFDFTKNRWYLE